jgi:hypothetical protein
MKTKSPRDARTLAKPAPVAPDGANVIRFPLELVKQQPAETQLVPCCYCHADRWRVRLLK